MDMELAQFVLQSINAFGVVGVLVWLATSERKRANDMTSLIVQDWRRQREEERSESGED